MPAPDWAHAEPWSQVYPVVRRTVTEQLSSGGERVPSLPGFAMDPPPEHLDHGVGELMDYCGEAFTGGLIADLARLGGDLDRLEAAARDLVPGRALHTVLDELIRHDLGGRFGVLPVW